MDATEIDVSELSLVELDKIVEWYNQSDKSWLYCDYPLEFDRSCVRYNIIGQLNTSFEELVNPAKVKYYSIKHHRRQIGFAVIRKNFDYFNNIQGYSIGLDIPGKDDRGKGYGTIAIRKLLHSIVNNEDIKINEIYLETLSYNTPMQKVAEKLGFELIDQKEMGLEYQIGFLNHIYEIAGCLNKEVEELQKEKVRALLYKINMENCVF